ncbi:MAG TPA: nuclear transport factor 2 family protein [Candidatus Acidoferrales bacterium]|nr:nuclear transport factor 2 family protein [Candidatus Acidoferrales bacterium]
MRKVVTNSARGQRLWLLLALALLVAAVPANAQKKDKNKNAPPPSDAGADIKAAMNTPDTQVIDQEIGEALGYWQIGDAESLHKYYADDVVVVSGAWEPPVIGWDNYLKSYQAQRAQVSGARMDRSNTLIKVSGNSAWATYQFLYVAQTQGNVVQFRGHTTLVLMKQANSKWLITLNHSSIVDSSVPEPANSMNSVVQPGNR